MSQQEEQKECSSPGLSMSLKYEDDQKTKMALKQSLLALAK